MQVFILVQVNDSVSLPFISAMTLTSRGVKSFILCMVDCMKTSWVNSLSTKQWAILVGLLAAFAKS